MATTKENLDQIQQSISDAKSMRIKELERFHVGDIVYPLYQQWLPLVWGTVVGINQTIHKVIVNINGMERQYDPQDLVLTSPELKAEHEREQVVEDIEERVSRAFKASSINRMARRLVNGGAKN